MSARPSFDAPAWTDAQEKALARAKSLTPADVAARYPRRLNQRNRRPRFFNASQAARIVETKDRLRAAGLLALAERIADSHHVGLDGMLSGIRLAPASAARHHFWHVVRSTLLLSFPSIADLTGHDHTTVMAGCTKHEARLAGGAT